MPSGGSRAGDLGLDRLPDGSYRYVDPQGNFTLTIAPDGRPYFADRWRRPSSADAQHGKPGRRPGARSFVRKPMGMGMQGPLEWLLRASGHDLWTSAKMSALRETEAFRTDLAIAWHRAQIRERLEALPAELLAVWHDDALSPAQRREILFEHWDACEDRLVIDARGIPAGAVLTVDRLRRDAGDSARQTILDFIRRELDEPQETFTDAELSRFNARRVSVSAFDPNAEPAPEPEPTAQDPTRDAPQPQAQD